jgi:phosphopantothenoylcysteine decarboxylase
MMLSETCQVRVCLTQAARHFVFQVSKSYDPLAWETTPGWHQRLAQPGWRAVYLDQDEWAYGEVGDPVLHIELRKWADAMVIAPASANTLGKLAHGLCDNLVTCIARAWDPTLPLLVCPAMNTHMWDHPLTEVHLRTLREVCGYRILDPVSKRLACGDVGKGAMAPVGEIVAAVGVVLQELDGDFKWRKQAALVATEAAEAAEAAAAAELAEAAAPEEGTHPQRILDSPSARASMQRKRNNNDAVLSDGRSGTRHEQQSEATNNKETKEGTVEKEKAAKESESGCVVQ